MIQTRSRRCFSHITRFAASGLLLVVLSPTIASQPRPPASRVALPNYIVENRGLYPRDVAYYLIGRTKSLFFTRGGMTVQLSGTNRTWAVKLEFEGANPEARPEGEDRQEAVFSYFRGSSRHWRTGLRSYARVVYRDLWPGIDLVYAVDRARLKYRFHIRPGADPARIRLRYRGAGSVEVTPTGSLRVTTPEGGFEDEAPVAFQTIHGETRSVEAAFVLGAAAGGGGATAFGFRLGRFDPERMLVLDPAVIVYCGYLGGAHQEYGWAVAVDAAGCAYVTGMTQSDEASFPVKVGPGLKSGGGLPNAIDAFVAKVNAAGTGLVYCGFIGGKSDDYATAVAVDAAGNAYVTGTTNSDETSFPVVIGPDLTYNGAPGWDGDAFVAKVNAKGTSLDYCGYIGGAALDGAGGIAVDRHGAAYVCGCTRSTEASFPVKIGPDLTYNGTNPIRLDDAFIAKVDATGTGLAYCGYLGGSRFDGAGGVAVDGSGCAYVCGGTDSADFPVKVGPDPSHNGMLDVFVAKVNANGSSLVYSGFIGGASMDGGWGSAIAVDAAGNAYVVGDTESDQATFPVRVGPDLTYNGSGDAFVAKVLANGSSLAFCGYLGGKQGDFVKSVAIDSAGYLYLAGTTGSDEATFPVRRGPDLTHNGTAPVDYDGFIARLHPSGTHLDYCGYVGGATTDYGTGIAVDVAGNAYLTGWTYSDEKSFPVRKGPMLQYTPGSGQLADAYVAKVANNGLLVSGTPRPGSVVTFRLVDTESPGLPYVAGSSLGAGPIVLGARTIDLSLDPLLVASVGGGLPGVFQGYTGLLDGLGSGGASMHIPPFPWLVGLRIHTAFVTLSPAAPFGVKFISDTVRIVITR